MINSLRGMNDILSEDYKRFTYFLEVASTVAQRYGFHFIETPILEETMLFKRSVGESSDIVGKEMYQFIDKGENDVCLRPEGTAGVVRAFVQKKLDRAGGIHRYYYYGPMFRYERPQKGRLRQFHQFGVESFGEASVYEDATMILMISDILNKLGVGHRVKINSLGDSNCMPAYRDSLVAFVSLHEEHICQDCQRRLKTNPIRVLDCKEQKCQEIYADAPKLINNLCQACDSDFATLKKILDAHSIIYEVDTNLVRGLDYYSKSAFEFVSDEIGSQSAIAGGGRYDRLVEFLDGRPTPAVGFAMGIERLMELIVMPDNDISGYYIGALDDDVLNLVFSLVQKKRKNDKVYMEFKSKSVKNHIKSAEKTGARYFVLVGSMEVNSGLLTLKDMLTREEKQIRLEEF